jgi:hypothetical protein
MSSIKLRSAEEAYLNEQLAKKYIEEKQMTTISLDKALAIEMFIKRFAKAMMAGQVNNASLYAGSPMYYYCKFCGVHTQTLPESHWGRPVTVCNPCGVMDSHGLCAEAKELALKDRRVLIAAIVKSLSNDLLKKGETGHCYHASEALYHMSGGKKSGLKPMNMKHEGSSHWFLLDGEKVVDPTSDQFESTPNYLKARGRGFMTKKPSKRAQMLIDKASRRLRYFY